METREHTTQLWMQLFWGISSIIEAHFRTCFMYHSKVLTMSNVLVLLPHYPWQMWWLPCPPRLSLEFRKGGSLWKPSAIVAPRSGCAWSTSPGEDVWSFTFTYLQVENNSCLKKGDRWPPAFYPPGFFLPLSLCGTALSLMQWLSSAIIIRCGSPSGRNWNFSLLAPAIRW